MFFYFGLDTGAVLASQETDANKISVKICVITKDHVKLMLTAKSLNAGK